MNKDPRSGKRIVSGKRTITAKQTLDYDLDNGFNLFYNVKKAE